MAFMTTMSYAKAVVLALSEAMAEDERVFCIGEEVGFGGAYGATHGLRDRFGASRVRDTPISESAIVGLSVGAALAGWRPVAEIMHFDFVALAMDQIVNQAAKLRYMTGGRATVPMVIRCPAGGWLNAAAQHSQSLESWFTHIPGLKVAAAGTPADIRDLLRVAIQDDDPIIVVESLRLYETSGDVPEKPVRLRLGEARKKRSGSDITLVTWGATIAMTLDAAATLAEHGIEADVLDLISLMPWDESAVLQSVARTHRLVIVHQATRRSGFGAEVSARVAEQGFDMLDAPIARVGALDTPIPFSPPLEQYVLPSAARIVSAVTALF
jgi:acetoin:2,6-dichlorophenolindophenol oxidoreductase subunit beta